MRKHAKRIMSGTSMQTRRFQVIGVVAVVTIFAIAATAISMQASKGEMPSNTRSNAVPLRSSQDARTQSQIRPLTQEEAQQMAEGLKNLVNQSTEGLKEVRHADGSISVDLQDRFQNVALARKADDGTVTQSCVDNPASAAAFLGIDREAIDGLKTNPAKTRQPARQTNSGGQN
jgi:hypothetical protein